MTLATRRRISQRELGISERLRALRDGDRWTQEEFAEQLAISRARLASYEDGRVAIRYDLALRICHQFIISEKWLAAGTGDQGAFMDLATDPVVTRVPPDMPFGEAYDQHLGSAYEYLFKERKGVIPINVLGGEHPMFIHNVFMRLLREWLKLLTGSDQLSFLIEFIKFGTAIMAVHKRDGKLPRAVEWQPPPSQPKPKPARKK